MAVSSPDRAPHRPSPTWWWAIAGTLCLSLVAAVWATVAGVASQRPVGEGELFLLDAKRAEARVRSARGVGLDAVLRRIRNDLDLEAVSLVTPEGRISTATSATLIGQPPHSPFLARMVEAGRFGAVATRLPHPIDIDGVTEWEAGDVVYGAVTPLPDGGGLLLTYDVSELLERRSRADALPTTVVQLGAASVLLAAVTGVLALARTRALRRFRELELASAYHERRAEDLAAHNRELERARRAAEEALALAEEKNRIRSEFVLMINHELRTPLTGVVTGAQVLSAAGTVTDPDARRILEDMVHDGRRLEDMVAQMLAVARIENRALFFHLVETPLSELVARVEQAANGRPVKVDTALGVERVTVATDPTTLAGLVAALAGNSTTHGATDVRLICGDRLPFEPMLEVGERPSEGVFFLVVDNGPGIAPEFLPRAFEKFEKAGRSSGTGLGLYMARKMAEALGASISVTTSRHGTAMAVGIPLAREDVR